MWALPWARAAVKKRPQTRLLWVHLRPDCSGCTHATLWHVFAHMHVFVRLSVPVFSELAGLPPLHCDCSSKPCSQATLSPGNTSEVHQGETSTRRKGRENRRKKKGQDVLAPPLAFYLLVLFCIALQTNTIPAFTLLKSGNSILNLQFGSSLQLFSETHMDTQARQGKVSASLCLWPAA